MVEDGDDDNDDIDDVDDEYGGLDGFGDGFPSLSLL